MALIDDAGRLFGRINVLDAAVLGCFGLLLSSGYGAYLLFQPGIPVIQALEPAVLYGSVGGEYLEVSGTDLRPYLRATLVAHGSQASLPVTLSLRSDTHGVVQLPPAALKVDAYDLVLFDEAQPVGQLSNALLIAPRPAPLRPRFVLDSEDAVIIDGVSTRFSVVKDRQAGTCDRFRSGLIVFRDGRTMPRPELMGAAPCAQ